MGDFSIGNDGSKVNGYMSNMTKLQQCHWDNVLKLCGATVTTMPAQNDNDPDISILEQNRGNIFMPSSPEKL
jgi:hypothetical protein